MSHNIEHFYRPDHQKKAFLPGCLALFFFLGLGVAFIIGLFYFVGWIS
ncbi:hypothetical protein [Ekhidna sp.]